MARKTPEQRAQEKEAQRILKGAQAKRAFWDFSKEVSNIVLPNAHNPQEAHIPRPISAKLEKLSRAAQIAMEQDARRARQSQEMGGSGGVEG